MAAERRLPCSFGASGGCGGAGGSKILWAAGGGGGSVAASCIMLGSGSGTFRIGGSMRSGCKIVWKELSGFGDFEAIGCGPG